MPVPRRRSGGVVIPHSPTWQQRVLGWAVWAVCKSVMATLRYEYQDRSGLFDGARAGPLIFCTWHNRLAVSMGCYYFYIFPRNPTKGLAAMVSASRDGGFLTAILERFGVQPVRGSSSRRGPQAMLELVTWAEQGYDVAITPDGPIGPRYVVQPGVTSLSQLTGLPIVPVAINFSRKISLRSWDRFQIPLPFARCEFVFGKPIRIPRDATDTERECLRSQLEQSLLNITRD